MESYSWFFNVFVIDVVVFNLYFLFFIGGGVDIFFFFKRERGVEENMIVLCKEIF